MHLMLQQPEADDYVVATGETHSVREFCELAFGEVGLDYRDYVRKNEAVYRPAEVDLLIGDYSKARKVLGWEPTVDFAGLVKEMVRSDMELLSSTLHHEAACNSFGEIAIQRGENNENHHHGRRRLYRKQRQQPILAARPSGCRGG